MIAVMLMIDWCCRTSSGHSDCSVSHRSSQLPPVLFQYQCVAIAAASLGGLAVRRHLGVACIEVKLLTNGCRSSWHTAQHVRMAIQVDI